MNPLQRSDDETRSDAARLIIESTRREIAKHGVLGVRVAEIAAGAHCSITQIYRYFGDRAGLLVRVLGDIYDELLTATVVNFQQKIGSSGPLTIDDIVNALPRPSIAASSGNNALRMQILAVASTNQRLQDRLTETSLRMIPIWKGIIEDMKDRLPAGAIFDDRAFTIGMVNQNTYYNQILGEHGATDEQFLEWFRHILTAKS